MRLKCSVTNRSRMIDIQWKYQNRTKHDPLEHIKLSNIENFLLIVIMSAFAKIHCRHSLFSLFLFSNQFTIFDCDAEDHREADVAILTAALKGNRSKLLRPPCCCCISFPVFINPKNTHDHAEHSHLTLSSIENPVQRMQIQTHTDRKADRQIDKQTHKLGAQWINIICGPLTIWNNCRECVNSYSRLNVPCQ